MSRRRANRASTLVLTLIFLSLFATLAVSFHAAANMSLQEADNHRSLQQAQMAAESGMAHMIELLRQANVDPNDDAEGHLLTAANHMADLMDGTGNVGAGEIRFDDDTISTPEIAMGVDGATYRAEIRVAGEDTLGVTIHGVAGKAVKSIYMEVNPVGARSTVFDYGIASRSRIVMSGNTSIVGVNDPSEASVLSATFTNPEAVKLTGSCEIAGEVSTSNPTSHVSVTGNPTIGGSSDWVEMQEHIHIGVGDVEFPEVDPTVFEPYATNIVDGSTSTNGNKTFENIRIKAGVNPTFAGNITIRGVVFIEQPNQVKFTGNLNFTGVIVTEDAGDDVYEENFIQFTGNMSSAGVEALPDETQFAELRDMPGSMLLAPGFGVKFTGNFKTMNGAIAADKFTFTGNAGGTVRGPIICYSDSDFTLSGNSHLKIDRSKYTGDPPGFRLNYLLEPMGESYLEL